MTSPSKNSLIDFLMNVPPPSRPLRVGLFGIGLDTYWSQFEGLKSRLEGYVQIVSDKLQRPGVEIVNLGLVDNPEQAQAVAAHAGCDTGGRHPLIDLAPAHRIVIEHARDLVEGHAGAQ